MSITVLLNRFFGQARGTLAVMTALAAPVLLAVMAIATDFVMVSNLRTELQAAADSAALGSAREIGLVGTSTAKLQAIAQAVAHQILPRESSNGISETSAAGASGGYKIDAQLNKAAGTVDVTIEVGWAPLFLHLISSKVTPVRVTARARSLGSGLVCVLALNNEKDTGVHLLKDASISANGCSVYANALGKQGIRIDDSAALKAQLICVAGGYVTKGLNAISPVPTTDCPPMDDPLAARKAPMVGPCDYKDLVIKDKVMTLDPGVYCGGLLIRGTSRVVLNEGAYIIADGPLRVTDTASLEGQYVGFYLQDKQSVLELDPATSIQLSAPRAGPLAGLLFFEDRTAPLLRKHRISSNNAPELLGTIYLSRGLLRVDASAPVAATSAYTAIVVRNLELDAGPNLVLNSNYDATIVPVPDGLIAERIVLSQ